MKKVAILTDSSSSIDFVEHQYPNIFQLRLTVHFGDESFIDGETITHTEFFDRIVNESVIPSTSQPSIGEVVEMCEKLDEAGYTDVIYLPLSKGISSSYSSIVGALDLVTTVNLHVVDTQSTAVYLGYMVLEAARLVSEGKTVEEVIDAIHRLRDHQHIYFMVNDLKYLIKNGRLSNAAGFIATMLRIKPVLEFDEDGKIVGKDKIRTTKKTIETIVGRVKEAKEKYKSIKVCMCHGLDEDLLAQFNAELDRHLDRDEILVLPLPPVIGAHVGNGVVSLGYFVLEE